jgi:hypothetical protein
MDLLVLQGVWPASTSGIDYSFSISDGVKSGDFPSVKVSSNPTSQVDKKKIPSNISSWRDRPSSTITTWKKVPKGDTKVTFPFIRGDDC